MYITGIGLVSACGRGVKELDSSLRKGWSEPFRKKFTVQGREGLIPLYLINRETMENADVLKKLRRADRITRMAVLAATDAVSDSGVVPGGGEPYGIIMATSYGAHTTKFKYKDDIIDFGEENISPMIFSHVIHNAAVSYVAAALKNRGPAFTVSQFDFCFHEALNIARAWMEEGRCNRVLVGASDETGDIMEAVFRRKWRVAEDGRIKPFAFAENPEAVFGEGSVFFMLSKEDSPQKYCEISDVCFGEAEPGGADMYFIDADGISGDERFYKNYALSGVMAGGYLPLFGSMMIGSAFSCAVAALSLKNQMRYACPVQENPFSANICKETQAFTIEEIHCVRYSHKQRNGLIKLRK